MTATKEGGRAQRGPQRLPGGPQEAAERPFERAWKGSEGAWRPWGRDGERNRQRKKTKPFPIGYMWRFYKSITISWLRMDGFSEGWGVNNGHRTVDRYTLLLRGRSSNVRKRIDRQVDKTFYDRVASLASGGD